MLYIVSTPIGNLDDITLRALKILENVDFVACEDTRKTGILLAHFNLKKKLISYHSHSGEMKGEKIIELLKSGNSIALVSDAGTPGISDPGYPLIQKAIEENIEIIPIPGASAFLTCLQASGMQANHFTYLGFLPIKKGRKTLLEKLKQKEHPVIIYESVHRIEKTLSELKEIFGENHQAVVGRELTKKFEEIKRGNFGEMYKYFQNKEKQKGEFVIIF
ncbi:16S rRNA (cytidine(1402)-2'-O)-methyltransferase [Candidatus Gracilibacteria bacterium]|nr:16S rRNA (cytidine(1402)-2'-O)-methyltransferase [Candidatus Gracilibacteria bacterium]NUJ98910.1 16S rRNA (cytidine(1402)-2'-O)-methyltransferase [Candidatus Gracilibacteria bacterium]